MDAGGEERAIGGSLQDGRSSLAMIPESTSCATEGSEYQGKVVGGRRKSLRLQNITNTLGSGGAVDGGIKSVGRVNRTDAETVGSQQGHPRRRRQSIAMSDDHRQKMEQQMEALQGKLLSIRREGVPVGGGRVEVAKSLQERGASGVASGHQGLVVSSRQQQRPLEKSNGFDGLAAKLESLKRDVPVTAPKSAGKGMAVALPGGDAVDRQFDVNALSRSAHQLFGDEGFIAMCEKGLTAQLSRSKDGATQDTKLKELAEIVKTMRKALKEMQHRAQLFVEQAVKYEREAAQHAESIRLKGDSAAMAASAELANVRREAATDAANHKAALASWQGEVDLHKSEAASLKRELERVEHEFGALKEAHKSLEKEKCGIENELNELKKVNCDREKELQADKNAATQTVYQVKEDYERQKDALVEALNEAREKIKLADEAQARISEQLKKARGEGEKLSADLQQTRVSLTQKEEELQKTHGALKQVQDEFEALQKEMEDSHKDNTSVRKQLEEWRQRAADLLSELEKERKVSENLKRSAEEQADTAATREERLKQSEVMYEDTIKAAKKREEELEKERDDLRKALEESKGQYNAVQATVEKMTRELEEASNELTCSQAALASLQQGAAKALIDLENANMRSQKAEEKLATVEKEASEKVARLAQLEGELEALQECTMGLEGGDQKELLSRMVTKIATLEAAVVAADAKRREAHNQLVELKGNIRVFCRVRPHPSGVAQCAADGTTIRVYADSKPYEFVFDRVFKPEVTQSGVFEQVADLVQSALDGYKVCLFSYGQTGAGKTYTMQGGNAPGQEGIIPRSISKILETVETLREQGWDYKLEASFVEVYNEQLRDLLVDGREAGKITENNAIQHLPNGGHTIIQGATRLEIASEYDAADIVNRAAACRAVESTAMNSSSSRSHSIFMLYITGCHEATETMLQGSLNLVDLAGSERLNRSQAEGQRAREACSINKSLSSLGDVFAALSSKQSHIPYRNSKLTHLLQPCLGGSGKTLMFVNINAEPTSAQESLCSLRFASKVNSCETAAKGGALRHASILDKGSRPSMTGRPSIMPSTTGRQSVATARRQSVAPGAASRRTSMIPAAASGVKRKPMGPPPVANPRPRFE